MGLSQPAHGVAFTVFSGVLIVDTLPSGLMT
jgi:hypothetical protein